MAGCGTFGGEVLVPSRREATQSEKGEHTDHFTVREFARYMGVSQDTIERWERSGKIPAHSVRSKHGWRLWSPDHVRDTRDKRLRGQI